jgi:hypothetical protein
MHAHQYLVPLAGLLLHSPPDPAQVGMPPSLAAPACLIALADYISFLPAAVPSSIKLIID